MMPTGTMQLWQDYLAAEQVRIRSQTLAALDRFIRALLQLPVDSWHPWARDLAMRVVDEGDHTRIRVPLFRAVVFPALHAGLEGSIPGCARWLAGLEQLLYQSRCCFEQLPENQRSGYGLLLRAISDDPSDIRAKKRLLILMRSRFEYVLHEVPWGVLCGLGAATVEECDDLLAQLSDYERLALEIGPEDADRELAAEARFHISAYQRYLTEPIGFTSYKEYLSLREDRPPSSL